MKIKLLMAAGIALASCSTIPPTPPNTTTTARPTTTVKSTTTLRPTTTTAKPTTTTLKPTTTTVKPTGTPCGEVASAPATYDHIVVLFEENRRWKDVGTGFSKLPYLGSLGANCAWYSDWIETNTSQSSLTQYIGLTSGVNNPATVNDCSVSTTCRSTDNNIFRQVREAGKTVRSYVEGATKSCSASGNAVRHIPAMYYYGTNSQGVNDHDFCQTEVRPLSEFNASSLPTLAFVTPNNCNNGHDCDNTKVDTFAKSIIDPVLKSSAYQAGKTAVVVIYDEDRPVPHLIIAPTAKRGPVTGTGSHSSLLKTWGQMLGLPILPAVTNATSLRSSAGI